MNKSISEQILKMMDVDLWVQRPQSKSIPKCHSNNAEWEKLQQEVVECKACPLFKTRTQTVFGTGNINAEVMFIGEAPGAQEDKQGEPFVGRAGQLLDAMLRAIGFSREDIYIANILKSRPPNNRDPLPEEVAVCTPFLIRQIGLIQPKLLVTLGRIAAQFLLNTADSIGSLRGKQFYYGTANIPTLAMYHPAYLLRSPQNKSKAYEDLCLIKRTLENLREGTDKVGLPSSNY